MNTLAKKLQRVLKRIDGAYVDDNLELIEELIPEARSLADDVAETVDDLEWKVETQEQEYAVERAEDEHREHTARDYIALLERELYRRRPQRASLPWWVYLEGLRHEAGFTEEVFGNPTSLHNQEPIGTY